MPGYTLLFLGMFTLRQPRAAGPLPLGVWLALSGALLDQVQNVMIPVWTRANRLGIRPI